MLNAAYTEQQLPLFRSLIQIAAIIASILYFRQPSGQYSGPEPPACRDERRLLLLPPGTVLRINMQGRGLRSDLS